jgi:ribosomal protein L24E
MHIKKILLLLTLGYSTPLMAFTCYVTLVKDSCWTDYNVKVSIVDTKNKKNLTTAVVPAKESWTRVSFDCNPSQQLEYLANFSPAFWENDKNKVFRSKQYRMLNSAINPTDVAWDIPVCFPAEFSEVPFPPQGDKNCKCDFSVVKPIEKPKDLH